MLENLGSPEEDKSILFTLLDTIYLEMKKKILDLIDLLNEYERKYPDAQTLENYMLEFGSDGLIRILKEANGRNIIFEPDQTTDEQTLDRSHIVSYE